MSEKSARAQCLRYDPRTYQIALLMALEWEAAAPGMCPACEVDSSRRGNRRVRITLYDAGMGAHLKRSSGTPTDAFADHLYAEMNHRQREGDFATVESRPGYICPECAVDITNTFITKCGESPELASQTVFLAARAALAGQRPWTAFVVVLEPGAAGRWRLALPGGDGVFDPDCVYRSVRRAVESGNSYASVFGTPGGLELLPLLPEQS